MDIPTRDHDTTGEPLVDATGRDEIMTVADAANVLGISPGAVRKRLERGQLSGQKVGGTWRIMLNATEATRRDTTARQDQTRHHDTTGDDQATTSTAISAAARSQLAAIRDEWLQPLVNQLREAERSIGRLEQERDQLRGEVERLHAATEPSAVTGEAERQDMSHTSPPPWWRRLWERWEGRARPW